MNVGRKTKSKYKGESSVTSNDRKRCHQEKLRASINLLLSTRAPIAKESKSKAGTAQHKSNGRMELAIMPTERMAAAARSMK